MPPAAESPENSPFPSHSMEDNNRINQDNQGASNSAMGSPGPGGSGDHGVNGSQASANANMLLSQEMELRRSKICQICRTDSDSYHLNYGAPTCLSCRAFFRRVIQNQKLDGLTCKKSGNCDIAFDARSRCRKCRMEACLRAGMKPEAVMNELQKKERFRNFRKMWKREKGAEGGPHGEGSSGYDREGRSPTNDDMESNDWADSNSPPTNNDYPRSPTAHPPPLPVRFPAMNGTAFPSMVPPRPFEVRPPMLPNPQFPRLHFNPAMAPQDFQRPITSQSMAEARSPAPNQLHEMQRLQQEQQQKLMEQELLQIQLKRQQDAAAAAATAAIAAQREEERQREESLEILRLNQIRMQQEEQQRRLQFLQQQHEAREQDMPINFSPPRGEVPNNLPFAGPSGARNMADEEASKVALLNQIFTFKQETGEEEEERVEAKQEPIVEYGRSVSFQERDGPPFQLKRRSKDDREFEANFVRNRLHCLSKSWMEALCNMRANQAFVDAVIAYHQHGTQFTKAMFAEHLKVLVGLFKDFSDRHSDFTCLTRKDQDLLLSRNTNLFVSFILSKYFGSQSGAEQFQWLFLLPENPFELRPITFREFNSHYNVLMDPKKFQRSNGILSCIASCGIERKSLHMIAHSCLFTTHDEDSYSNKPFIDKIRGSLVDAYGWEKEEHDDMMRDLAGMAKLYSVMNWGVSVVDMVRGITLPFTKQELEWISFESRKVVNCFKEVSLGEVYIKQMISCELFGVSLPKDFFLNFIGLWSQRFLVLMKGHQEFNLLTSSTQNKVWQCTILPLFAIVLIKFENAGTIQDQLNFALGSDDMTTMQEMVQPWGNIPDLIAPIKFSRSNKRNRIASEETQSRAETIKREVIDFVADNDVFYNAFLFLLFEDARDLLGSEHDVMKVSDRYFLALQRQLRTRLNYDSERFGRGMTNLRAYANLIKFVFASHEETVARPASLQGVSCVASTPATSQAMISVQ